MYIIVFVMNEGINLYGVNKDYNNIIVNAKIKYILSNNTYS